MRISVSLFLMCFVIYASQEFKNLKLDVESGIAFSGYNDVRIPNDGGTLFSLSEELKAEPTFFYRIRTIYRFKNRHYLGLLLAPLKIHSSGKLNKNLIFQNDTFPANTELEAMFKFNSYRIFYWYDIVRREKLVFGLGFTAKIRDAKIRIKSKNIESENSNVGFVPIIHFRFIYRLNPKLSFLVDGDALVAPQGRAEDILTAIKFNLNDKINFKLGYRILEGGSDSETVYTFALIHYGVLGVEVKF